MAKHDTFEAFYRAHLKDGPDSSRLEFKRDYYQKLDASPSSRLPALLKERPEAAELLASANAVTTAMTFFHPELGDYDDSFRGTASRYRDVAQLAVSMFQVAPEAFDIETLPVMQELLIPPSELREVGRLAVQKYKVYTALAETGEVPEL